MRGDVVRRAIWIVAAVKLLMAALTLGTNDMSFFRHFGWELYQHGLGHEYRHDPLFNHTPLVGGYATFIALLSFGNERVFAFLLRVPGILADVAVCLALVRRTELRMDRPLWLVLAFALSPTAFMVSGFHGNVDSVLACFVFLAALAAERRDPVRCALWFALACNIKVAPLFIAPVFFIHFVALREGRRFFAVASAGILLGWLPALIVAPVDFLRQVLGYAGYWGIWGVTWVLRATAMPELQVIGAAGTAELSHSQVIIMQVLKFALMAGALVTAWVRRGRDLWTTLAVVWCLFMVLASGVAAQYLVWPMAILFVVAPECWAIAEVGNAVFLFVFYTALCGGLPWYYGQANAVVNERWLPWNCVAWAGWMLCALRLRFRTPCLSPVRG